MSARELNQLWNLVRKNETTIAVLSEKLGAQNDAIAELREDNAAMKAILNRAIGAKTIIGVVGAAVVAVVTWAVTYFSKG